MGPAVLATHYSQWLCMFRRVVRGFLCQLVEEQAVGPAFWQPTIFSGSVCFEWLCVTL